MTVCTHCGRDFREVYYLTDTVMENGKPVERDRPYCLAGTRGRVSPDIDKKLGEFEVLFNTWSDLIPLGDLFRRARTARLAKISAPLLAHARVTEFLAAGRFLVANHLRTQREQLFPLSTPAQQVRVGERLNELEVLWPEVEEAKGLIEQTWKDRKESQSTPRRKFSGSKRLYGLERTVLDELGGPFNTDEKRARLPREVRLVLAVIKGPEFKPPETPVGSEEVGERKEVPSPEETAVAADPAANVAGAAQGQALPGVSVVAEPPATVRVTAVAARGRSGGEHRPPAPRPSGGTPRGRRGSGGGSKGPPPTVDQDAMTKHLARRATARNGALPAKEHIAQSIAGGAEVEGGDREAGAPAQPRAGKRGSAKRAEMTLENGARVSGSPTAVEAFLASGSNESEEKPGGKPKSAPRRRRKKTEGSEG